MLKLLTEIVNKLLNENYYGGKCFCMYYLTLKSPYDINTNKQVSSVQ